jgi:hypothetical protein
MLNPYFFFRGRCFGSCCEPDNAIFFSADYGRDHTMKRYCDHNEAELRFYLAEKISRHANIAVDSNI